MKAIKRYIPLLATLLLLTGCSQFRNEPVQPAMSEQPVQTQPEDEAAPEQEQLPEQTLPEEPAEEPVGESLPEEEPALPTYDFSQPAPEREAVDNTYFEDAAFVGDSRTDGFMIYSGIGCGKNLTSNGLSIFQLKEKKALKIGGKEYTLLEALEMGEYGKVYLCLGVNELGVHDDEGFYQSYLAAIDTIRAIQPRAIIYIQGLIPLNEEEIAASGGRDYLKNDHLRIYNDLMRKAAEEKQVVFLDLYAAFADETGALPAGASRDGVHLKKDFCQKWLEYLKTHTVDNVTLGLSEREVEEVAPL